jgi:hypothetical protein
VRSYDHHSRVAACSVLCVPGHSQLTEALSAIDIEGDEIALLLSPETPDDATVLVVPWANDQRAIACISERDGLVLHVLLEGARVQTTRIGHLPDATITEQRGIYRDGITHQRVLNTEQLELEHPRLSNRLTVKTTTIPEDRVEQIRQALVALARTNDTPLR